MADNRRKPAAQKSREELRRENRQALETKKRRRKAILIIALVAVVVLTAVILSLTVFFKITAVEVDASKTQYKAEQIRTASGIETGENLFLMDRDKAAEQISEQLPFTGDIQIKRSLPGKVRITVEDSKIAAAVKYNDQYIVLNENNKVLAKVGSIARLNELVEQQEALAKKEKAASKKTTTTTAKDGTATTTETTTTTTTTTAVSEETTLSSAQDIAGGEDLSTATDKVTVITGIRVKSAKVGHLLTAKNSEMFETYNRIMDAMAGQGITEITAADLTKVTDLRLTYQKRITILLGSASALERKAALCAKVLEEQNKVSTEQKGTIDLSIEGKAYFSESGATTRTTTTTTEALTTVPVTDASGETITSTETTQAGETTTAADGSTEVTSTTRDPADIGG